MVGLRIGLGFDIHRLEPASEPDAGIALAGLRLPCPWRVIAHSDGDVVLHALCDALLGAAAAGDLGEHFPDSDPAHRGRPSAWFLERVRALPALAPWRIANVDINVIAEVPRLAPHKPALRARLAELLALPLAAVSLKARTHEGLDAIGERRAIAAQAAVLLMAREAA
ncbi:MAG: 2-C-methyl-D-erythritol 2,4-cyclodiphosphate synthase [Planctomycetota bacterium]|nr:2-C-methyl-D-erythritol 2,4-cyclodiphosphate synthase [Planctomycetota bacterium]MCX8040348.1 2-C-methyl-D-erythritol 2,4-cyclodiphosphate synthase [Planctomycetota bacterium]MDW8373804.1 2-C-methyl-D-erythritol 2,4-cyclodiphosphate synthase [Planctomycetota bacterium]